MRALHKISSAQASSTKDRDLVMTRFSDRALVIVEAELREASDAQEHWQEQREERLQRQQHRDCLPRRRLVRDIGVYWYLFSNHCPVRCIYVELVTKPPIQYFTAEWEPGKQEPS